MSLLNYVIRRVFQFIPMVAITSVLIYFIIELPPGDYLTMHIVQLQNQGTIISETEIARLKDQYGLDKPLTTRYLRWIWNIVRYGDFGRSFDLSKPVSEVIGERIVLTMVISLFSLVFVWLVAIPIGIYSAVHQYSPFDYGFTFVGFIGLAVPDFLLALLLVYISFAYLENPITGLFSPEYLDARWSWLKVGDMLRHIWVPVIVIGMGGTASLIRITRGTLLDELRKPYVMTARAKGVQETKLLLKYPVRIAINPLISTIGWLLPSLVSGTAITSIVLNLPTMGPVLLQALLAQDMYLAGSFMLILSVLTMIGTLLSDILLALVDPRIRYGGGIRMRLAQDMQKQQEEAYYVASQWQLIWWKFRKHRLAMIGAPVLGFFYFLAIFCEFLSPYTSLTRFPEYVDAPPQRVRLFGQIAEIGVRPFVYGLAPSRDPVTLARLYTPDKTRMVPLRFFVRGEPYKFWGLFRTNLHFFGGEGEPIFLMGTDPLGRDLLSRIVYGSRISLSIGLVGIFLTFLIGLTLGGISGYYGGVADTIVQRTIDELRSIPTLPLWMTLAAALPRNWTPTKTYFGIVVVLSVVGWTSLARVVRGKFLSLRNEDFILAARLAGASEPRIIARHLLPSFMSYIIVSVTLSIPNMILSETALSFIGLGLQPPVVSWGVLLQDAQHLRAMALHPWILIPCLFVIVTVLTFNFLGDGLRDAADPYGR